MTSVFLTPLRVEKIGPQTWLLIDDLHFQSQALDRIVIAPRGFQTDFASIPRFLWSIFPKVDRWDAAAAVHDAGYAGALTDIDGNRIAVTKKESDRLFLEGCRALKVNVIIARIMYVMVRLFGDPLDHPLVANAWPAVEDKGAEAE